MVRRKLDGMERKEGSKLRQSGSGGTSSGEATPEAKEDFGSLPLPCNTQRQKKKIIGSLQGKLQLGHTHPEA